ncbi:MAG: hypothetical protein K0S92_1554, partial [Desertimonas sp.]|nr:hypothetical protein [Desertimonas sp.]
GLDDGTERIAREQDGAEHRLLGLQVVRWNSTTRGRTGLPTAVPRGV